ncbi:hypothetical protein AOLI_G00303730 [Acnodon oligacanthus]
MLPSYVRVTWNHNISVLFSVLSDQLMKRDLVVVIFVHLAEDLVHTLLRCQAILIHAHHNHSADHFIDRLGAKAKDRWQEDEGGMSYMLKAQLSFCSKLPLEVMDRAQMNSLKSIVPSPFLSKVRKAC